MPTKKRLPSKPLKPNPPDLVRVYVMHPFREQGVDHAVADSFLTTPERGRQLAKLEYVVLTPPKASPKPRKPRPPNSCPLPPPAQEYLKKLKDRGADPERLAMILYGYLPPYINAVHLHRDWRFYCAIPGHRTWKVGGRTIPAWRLHYDQLDRFITEDPHLPLSFKGAWREEYLKIQRSIQLLDLPDPLQELFTAGVGKRFSRQGFLAPIIVALVEELKPHGKIGEVYFAVAHLLNLVFPEYEDDPLVVKARYRRYQMHPEQFSLSCKVRARRLLTNPIGDGRTFIVKGQVFTCPTVYARYLIKRGDVSKVKEAPRA